MLASPCRYATTAFLLTAIAALIGPSPDGLPAVAEGESPIAFEAASAQQACLELEGSPRDGDPRLVVFVPLEPAQVISADPLSGWPECLEARRLRPGIMLEPPVDWPSAPDPYAALSDWLGGLERLMPPLRGHGPIVMLGRRPDRALNPQAYAFLVEKVGSLIASIDPEALLVLGAMGGESMEWLESLDAARIAPYLDGVSLEPNAGRQEWVDGLGRLFPGLAIWRRAEPGEAGPGEWIARYRESRAAGAAAVIAGLDTPPPTRSVLLALLSAIPARFVIDPDPPEVTVERMDGGAAGAPLASFADPLGPERTIVIDGGAPVRFIIGPDPVARVRVVDLGAPGAPAAASLVAPGQGRSPRAAAESVETSVAILETAGPVLVSLVLVREPRGRPETIGVTGEEELTAEQIIARHRVFEAGQDRALRHYQAKATISYHYRAESLNEAIDVTSENRFYWQGGAGEYEEIDLYINGARWRGKPPSLPFITPEKVKEVPLEIRLDQSYTYRLEGRDDIDDRPVYRLSFVPVDAGLSLYSGEVWIDRETFARLRIRLVQHNLKDPITSNTDTIDYGAVEAAGPGGSDQGAWRLPVRAYRQMVFTVLGRSVAVERRVVYEDFSVNADLFDQAREQAYASGRPILRDDDAGTAYLVMDADGVRRRQAESLRNIALFGGLGANVDGGVGTPFAGLNFFDFDWRGTGTQIDVAFAGALIDLVWTDPSMAGTRFELSLEGRLTALPDRFKKVTSRGRIREEDFKVLEQRGYLTLARPVTTFSKAELQVELGYDNFSTTDDTESTFALPATRLAGAGTFRYKYNRRGWVVDFWYTHGHRFGWEDWGPPDPNGIAPPLGGTAQDEDYQRWGTSLLKSFYPGRLQKVSLAATLQAGRELDRLSRFRIGDFRNVRVRGYNSFDITFDRGATTQVSWLVNLPRGGASIDFGIEGAAIENEQDFDSREYLAGGGAVVSFSGPWGTLMSVRAGVAIGSSLDMGAGGVSMRALMIKTFSDWPWRRKVSPPAPDPPGL